MKENFSDQLLSWYDQNGRKDLPWQQDRTPYRVWLSEIMLQQTQVATVIPYFERFVERFPNVQSLAMASLDEVMSLWAGLGYYARARNLHRCAGMLHEQYDGQFPDDPAVLQTLPGIGRSTAGAIVAQAFDRRAVILDGNVKRVVCRYRRVSGWPGTARVQKQLWGIADELTPRERCADYTQAIMDLGAMICARKTPRCSQCPVSAGCEAARQGDPGAYPEKRATVRLDTRAVTALLCFREDGNIMLERRPPAGIWGGLWSLPECGRDEDPATFLKNRYGYTMEAFRSAPTLMHTFTHFKLQIHPVLAQVHSVGTAVADSQHQWCSPDDVQQMGLPRPVHKLVTDYFQSFNYSISV